MEISDSQNIKKKTIFGFIWRLIQNAGTQIISFVISIVLARILSPSDYGQIALITVFTGIAMVFVNTGFSSAVIQKKDLADTDTSTIFHTGMIIAIFLYSILFFAAPSISVFYNDNSLTSLLRVESLIILIGASYSVQQALITRFLLFKKSFLANACGLIAQGVTGIIMALNGYGPWALVISTVVGYSVIATIMWLVVEWKPKLVFSLSSFRAMSNFSIQLLASGLLDSLYISLRSLIIGKQYSSEDLAIYNKGNSFPSLIMTQIDGAMTTVLFSSLSKSQDNWDMGLRILRRALKTSTYVCFPLMAGLCAIAKPMIVILLTDKWIGSAEYVYLSAIICAFWPLSACRHALNARGKSGVSLILNCCSVLISTILLLLTYKYSVRFMVISSIISAIICQVAYSFVYSKMLQYKIKDQVADILPSIILSSSMGVVVYSITLFGLSNFLTLLIQIPLGILFYVGCSIIFKVGSTRYLIDMIKSIIFKRTLDT